LEFRKFRDIICSNVNAINGTGDEAEDEDEVSALPNLIPLPARNNVIFYHVPKTGGESLEMALGIKKNHSPWWNRQTAASHRLEHVAVTIVRNPYDRMMSWFRFCLHGYRGGLPGPKAHCLLAHSHIADTLPRTTTTTDSATSKTLEQQDRHQHHTPETVSMAFESWLEEILMSPKLAHHYFTYTYQQFIGGIRPLRLDYIIRFEHYEDDYALLARALGMEDESLPKQNGSTENRGQIDPENESSFGMHYDTEVAALLKKGYRDIYTVRAKELVEMVFEADLLYFNYTF